MAGDKCADGKIIDLAKCVQSEPSGAVDDSQTWYAVQPTPPRRNGQGLTEVVSGNANRKCVATLQQEHVKRHGVIASCCSNTQRRPSTVTSSPKTCWMPLTCGSP